MSDDVAENDPAWIEACRREEAIRDLLRRYPDRLTVRAVEDLARELGLSPASFFEKKQAIDNATKVANFGTLYWAHLRLGRLNGPKFYCVRGGFRR